MDLQDIKKVACVGTGLIGSSWATSFAKFGYDTHVYDAVPESIAKAKERISANFEVFRKNGYMTREEVDAAIDRIRYFDKLADAVRDVQFIQESGPESLAIKQEIVEQLDKANPAAIVCSSTSGLNISDISANSRYPQRYIGGHPYNPPHIMPLVELTKWEKTDEALVKNAYEFYKLIKKEPVILNKETPGFIGNRLQTAFVKEAIEIVMEGICSIEDLDIAARYGLGVRWAILGPNLNGQLNGGTGGISAYFGGHFKNGWDNQFKKIVSSQITELPDEFVNKIGPEGVAAEMRNRPPETGNTNEEITQYRDKCLLGILSLFGKM